MRTADAGDDTRMFAQTKHTHTQQLLNNLIISVTRAAQVSPYDKFWYCNVICPSSCIVFSARLRRQSAGDKDAGRSRSRPVHV